MLNRCWVAALFPLDLIQYHNESVKNAYDFVKQHKNKIDLNRNILKE
jgi:hypothetical protein